MGEYTEAFVGVDAAKARNAIAVAAGGRGGGVRYLGAGVAPDLGMRVAVARLAARRFARPVEWLERMALRPARVQGKQDYDLALQEFLGPTPGLVYSREMTGLYQSVASLAQ